VTDSDPGTDLQDIDPEARARALQSLLVEQDLLSTDAVNDIVATYEHGRTPATGSSCSRTASPPSPNSTSPSRTK